MINDLIKIADVLDNIGLREEADFADSIIKSAVERSRSVQNFIDQLKKAFQNISSSSKAFPNIHKALPEILRIIELTSEYRSFVQPSIKDTMLESMHDPINMLVENIVTLQDNIEDIEHEMKQKQNPNELNVLRMELQHYVKELKTQFDKVKQLKESARKEDAEKFIEFVKKYDEKRRQKILKDFGKQNK